MSEQLEKQSPPANKYAKLPERIRPEDMRTTRDVQPCPFEKGEYDRETQWMLRTTGLFI